MSKHRTSEWVALQNERDQALYERDDARRQWKHWREQAYAFEGQLTALKAAIQGAKELFKLLRDQDHG